MRVVINQTEYQLPHQSVVSDALALIDAKPPYAVAVNMNFVPKSQHTQLALQENDEVEVITPVTGG